MTISSEVSSSGPYNGNGVTTVFAYDFKIVDASHLRVVVGRVDGTTTTLSLETGDYSVTGVGDDGGDVVVVVPPPSGQTLTIVRAPPFTQETQLSNQGAYNASAVEARLDLIVMQAQALKESISRAFMVEPGQVPPTAAQIAYAATAAEIAADGAVRAEAAAAGVSLPPVVPNSILFDNPAGTARVTRTFAEARGLLEIQKATGVAALNSMMVGKADASFEVKSRDDAKKPGALSLVGIEDTKQRFNGLRPDRLSANVLRIQPGQCADGAEVPTDIMYLPKICDIDLTRVGLVYDAVNDKWDGGMDVGSPVAGTGYFPYLIKNPTTGVVSAVVSKEISTFLVTKPSGFTLIRKMNWGFIYSAGNTAGIPLSSLSHWPHPYTNYTDSSEDADWRVVNGGTAANFTAGAFSVAGFVPDSARLVYLCAVTQGTVAGKSFVRSTGSGQSGKIVGRIGGSGQASVTRFTARPSSLMALNYMVDTVGVSVSIYVEGYDQTEVAYRRHGAA